MRLAVLLHLLALVVLGAASLSFLCDDAYITFRYVSNAMDGHGLVWNPPPFLPVEGYTGFLWALMLWAVWGVLGIEPPDSANVLSMLWGIGQFAVIAAAAFRLRGRGGAPVGDVVALVALACIVGNRTFLQWMTGGLETALFNFGFVAWAVLAFRGEERRDVRWLAAWSTAAAIAALTRPDGLLLVAATVTAALPSVVARDRLRTTLLGLLPLATVLAHVLWRRWFYGDWLPNTYYAKVVAPWPEAGIPYLECFLFEHGLWLWFPVALVWGVRYVVAHRGDLVATLWHRLPALAVLGAIVFHTGYYVIQVGGDHFEYRVLSQLVPLAWLSLAAMCAQLFARTWLVLAALGATFLFSTVGWLHLGLTRDMPATGAYPLANKVPLLLRPAFRWHDAMQMHLHIHYVGMRCNQIAANCENFQARYTARGDFNTDPQDIPVLVDAVVGTTGWYLRDCAIIDWLGLNDWVVARTAPIGEDRTAVQREGLLATSAGFDVDKDGWWTRDELGRWIASFFTTKVDLDTAAPVLDMAFFLFAGQRSDALSRDEVAAFLHSLYSRGAMAHERVPPPGYIEAFERNVTIEDKQVTVTKRAVPLKPRLPAIEAEWREKARRGELKAR